MARLIHFQGLILALGILSGLKVIKARHARGVTDMVTGAIDLLGQAESMVSPDAMRTFCHQNGYTKWIGSGPEPQAPIGLLNNAWGAWGTLTGVGFGAVTPGPLMDAKCHGADWVKPGESGGTIQVSPGSGSVQITHGSSGGGGASRPNAVTGLVTGAIDLLGQGEAAVSPDAMRTFCHQNGYTKWIGSGPEPQAPIGLLNNALGAWGTLTGVGFGAVTPGPLLAAKCQGANWAANAGAPNPPSPPTVPTVSIPADVNAVNVGFQPGGIAWQVPEGNANLQGGWEISGYPPSSGGFLIDQGQGGGSPGSGDQGSSGRLLGSVLFDTVNPGGSNFTIVQPQPNPQLNKGSFGVGVGVEYPPSGGYFVTEGQGGYPVASVVPDQGPGGQMCLCPCASR